VWRSNRNARIFLSQTARQTMRIELLRTIKNQNPENL
jgi:hypothetical protein